MKLVIRGTEPPPEPKLELYLDLDSRGFARVKGRIDNNTQTLIKISPEGEVVLPTTFFFNNFRLKLVDED